MNLNENLSFSMCFSVGGTKKILTITLFVLLTIVTVTTVLLICRVRIGRRIIIQQRTMDLKIEGSKQAEGAQCAKYLQHLILVAGAGEDQNCNVYHFLNRLVGIISC